MPVRVGVHLSTAILVSSERIEEGETADVCFLLKQKNKSDKMLNTTPQQSVSLIDRQKEDCIIGDIFNMPMVIKINTL